MEPFLRTEGGAPALRTVAEELERDTVACSWRALAEEFALDTDGGTPPALRNDETVFVLATD